MNAFDILKYGHLWVLKHVEGLSHKQWETPGVCGIWSTREILAHLTSFEYVLEDVLSSCLRDGPTPVLDQFTSLNGNEFNRIQVGLRKEKTPAQVLDEYIGVQSRVMDLIAKVPVETLRRPGTIPWYGMQYAIDDYIVYAFYGHKREHCAQIAIYRDTLK